jgi:hypothetical protein
MRTFELSAFPRNSVLQRALTILVTLLLTTQSGGVAAQNGEHNQTLKLAIEESLKDLRKKFFEASEDENIASAKEHFAAINQLIAANPEILNDRPGLRSRLNCQLAVIPLPAPSKRIPISKPIPEFELIRLENECFTGVTERPNEYSAPDSYYKIARLLCLTNETLCSQIAQKRVQQERSNPLRKGTYLSVTEAWKDARSFSPTCRKSGCASDSIPYREIENHRTAKQKVASGEWNDRDLKEWRAEHLAQEEDAAVAKLRAIVSTSRARRELEDARAQRETAAQAKKLELEQARKAGLSEEAIFELKLQAAYAESELLWSKKELLVDIWQSTLRQFLLLHNAGNRSAIYNNLKGEFKRLLLENQFPQAERYREIILAPE